MVSWGHLFRVGGSRAGWARVGPSAAAHSTTAEPLSAPSRGDRVSVGLHTDPEYPVSRCDWSPWVGTLGVSTAGPSLHTMVHPGTRSCSLHDSCSSYPHPHMSEEYIIKHKETLKATVTKTQVPFPKARLTSKHPFLHISRFSNYTISSTPGAS